MPSIKEVKSTHAQDASDASDEEWSQVEALLRTWKRRTREGQHSHHGAGKAYRRAHYAIAVPTIALTTALGTSALATISNAAPANMKIVTGVVGLLAAVSGAIQLNLRLPERGEKHKNLGAQYGNIRRSLEATLAIPRKDRGDPKKVLTEIQSQLDRISNEGEAISDRRFKKTVRQLQKWDEERGRALSQLPN
ncbi:SLATT domain-containing protein [Plantactinospora sp. WMMB334]|uniref:SLATT domain-containing protein n=1 Tax=Plantactinospora sp. WMMB334 TaxID=3404119 RepID=UPI003B952287